MLKFVEIRPLCGDLVQHIECCNDCPEIPLSRGDSSWRTPPAIPPDVSARNKVAWPRSTRFPTACETTTGFPASNPCAIAKRTVPSNEPRHRRPTTLLTQCHGLHSPRFIPPFSQLIRTQHESEISVYSQAACNTCHRQTVPTSGRPKSEPSPPRGFPPDTGPIASPDGLQGYPSIL